MISSFCVLTVETVVALHRTSMSSSWEVSELVILAVKRETITVVQAREAMSNQWQ